MQEMMTLAGKITITGNTITQVVGRCLNTTNREQGMVSTTNREQGMVSTKLIITPTGRELKTELKTATTETTETITETVTQRIILPNTHRGQ
jgi:hypothetical protein